MSKSSAPTSQRQVNLVIVLDVYDLTMLSDEQIDYYSEHTPENHPFLLLSGMKRLLTHQISQQVPEEKLVELKNRTLQYIQEYEALQIYSSRWKTAKKFLKLVNRISQESNNNVAVFILCEDGLIEGQAVLRMSSLESDIPFDSLRCNDESLEKIFFNVLKYRFGPTWEVQVVTSRERTLAIAAEYNLSQEVINGSDDFNKLHDRWSERWFPNQQEGLQPSTTQNVQTSGRRKKLTISKEVGKWIAASERKEQNLHQSSVVGQNVENPTRRGIIDIRVPSQASFGRARTTFSGRGATQHSRKSITQRAKELLERARQSQVEGTLSSSASVVVPIEERVQEDQKKSTHGIVADEQDLVWHPSLERWNNGQRENGNQRRRSPQ